MISIGYLFSSVQLSCTVVSNSLRPHGLQHTSLPITNSWSLCKLMSIESVVPSNHLILSLPLLLLLSAFPASGSFPVSQALRIRWPKNWSFSVSPSNECSGLIYFRIDCFHFPAVQGALKTKVFSSPMIQKHSFFLALSLLYGPTLTSVHDYWKNHSTDYTDLCQQSNVSAF